MRSTELRRKQFEFRKQRFKKPRKPLYSEYFWKCRIFSTIYSFRPTFAVPG